MQEAIGTILTSKSKSIVARGLLNRIHCILNNENGPDGEGNGAQLYSTITQSVIFK